MIDSGTAGTDGATPIRAVGAAHVLYARDVGLQIDLDAARAILHDGAPHRAVRLRRATPPWFDYDPPPLRLVVDGPRLEVDGAVTEPAAECLLYDFGAVVVAYRIPLDGPLERLPALGRALLEHPGLLADSEARTQHILDLVRAAVRKPSMGRLVEDYVVYALSEWGGAPPAVVLDRHRELVARTLEADAGPLSEEEIRHAVDGRLGFTPHDLAVIDWNAALLLDAEPDDVLAVLGHANVELLELRVLDASLERLLDDAQRLMSRIGRRHGPHPSFHAGRLLRDFAELQTDSALLFEGVHNAIKLVGDQYLARVYRTAAEKIGLRAWDAAVVHKLAIAESVYQKMTDARAARRLEMLEIIIIVLIAVSIVMPFLGIGH